MPIVDRSILRLAVFEMFHCDDVPVSVSIDEAVERNDIPRMTVTGHFRWLG